MADKLTYGGYYFSTPAVTTLAAATPAKAAGTTSTMAVGNGFTHTDNRLTLDAGQTTRDYSVTASFGAVKGGGGSTDGKFYIAKNGSILPQSLIIRTLANTSDHGAMSIGVGVELEADDYVELWVETVNGDDLTIESGGLGVKVLG